MSLEEKIERLKLILKIEEKDKENAKIIIERIRHKFFLKRWHNETEKIQTENWFYIKNTKWKGIIKCQKKLKKVKE